MWAVGIIFYECGECVEIGVVVAVFVGSFVAIGADDVIACVGCCFGGGIFFGDVSKDLSRFFGISDGELISAFFDFKAGDPFGCCFIGFFELARGFVGFADAPQAVEAQDFAGGHGFVARGFWYALVRGDGPGVFFRLEEEIAHRLICLCAERAVGVFFGEFAEGGEGFRCAVEICQVFGACEGDAVGIGCLWIFAEVHVISCDGSVALVVLRIGFGEAAQ